MSFEDYVNHMKQKYRLITAISIIKTKPANISIDEYINILRRKIDDETTLDLVCSDDFRFNDDDETVCNTQIHYNDEQELKLDDIVEVAQCSSTTERFDVKNSPMDNNDKQVEILAYKKDTPNKQSKMLTKNICDRIINSCNILGEDKNLGDGSHDLKHKGTKNNLNNETLQRVTKIDDVNAETFKSKDNTEINNSVGVLQGYDNMDHKGGCLGDVFEILREIDDKIVTQVQDTQNYNNSDKTFYESQLDIDMENIPVNIIHKDISKTNKTDPIDSQQTELYSIHGFTQNNTSISQSQTQNIIIPQKYIYRVNSSEIVTNNNKNNLIINKNISTQKEDNKYSIDTNKINTNNITHAKYLNNTTIADFNLNITNNFESNNINTDNLNSIKNIKYNKVESAININNTTSNFDLNKMNKKDINKNHHTKDIADTNNVVYYKTNSAHDLTSNSNINEILSVQVLPVNALDVTLANIRVISQEKTNNNINKYEENILNTTKTTLSSQNEDISRKYLDDTNILSQNVFTLNDAQNALEAEVTADISGENMDIDEVTEVVPFKIIEELNRLKSYLSRETERGKSRDRDGYSTDSGYRSDTQGRYMKSSSQLSASCLNQSAHSLFNFLTLCPLLPKTKEIVTEISVVFGKLLDKLHEQENYPSFLEELLDNVEMFLKTLHAEDSGDALLNKEELSQRLMLLNKSTHIQKFTIEKITKILEETHIELTKTDTKNEIENINIIENLCYIFNLLQLLLTKYLKRREYISQSQDEGNMFKMSSVSEIWRKKWDTDVKIKKTQHNVEKRDVLDKCSEILNKIIVECIDGYSLIAFYALKCFNLLQS